MNSTCFISESADIDWDTVQMGDNCHIGPYCVLRNCKLGDGVYLSSHVSIGEPPEVTGFTNKGQPVVIGSRVRIREFVTIHAGWKRPTIIASDAQIFRHAHIAHDCVVAESALVSGGAIMCGHSVLQAHAVLSAGAILHQFVVVGQGAFIGAGCVVNRHVRPLDKVAVRSPAVIGSNTAKANLVDWSLALEFFYAAQERMDPCDGKSEERKILS